VIPQLLKGTSPGFPKGAKSLVHLHKIDGGRAAGDPEAGSAPSGRIAAERPPLPGTTADVPGAGQLRTWFQQFYQNRGGAGMERGLA